MIRKSLGGIACETKDRAHFEAEGLAGQRADAPSNISHEGPTGMEGAGGQAAAPAGDRAWPGNTQTPRPIGGRREACGAWPGFEPTRRAKRAARTASGRAGRATAGDLSGQQAPHTRHVGITKPPGPNGAGRQWR